MNLIGRRTIEHELLMTIPSLEQRRFLERSSTVVCGIVRRFNNPPSPWEAGARGSPSVNHQDLPARSSWRPRRRRGSSSACCIFSPSSSHPRFGAPRAGYGARSRRSREEQSAPGTASRSCVERGATFFGTLLPRMGIDDGLQQRRRRSLCARAFDHDVLGLMCTGVPVPTAARLRTRLFASMEGSRTLISRARRDSPTASIRAGRAPS